MILHRSKKDEKFEEHHEHEQFLLFLCFLSSALIGYFLTNYVALFGA
jgi:hypothetical protein